MDVVALTTIAEAAVHAERASGVPAPLSAAICALESQFLRAAPGWNCFGLKSFRATEARQLLATTDWYRPEDMERVAVSGRVILGATGRTHGRYSELRMLDWFRRFPSLREAFQAFAALIRSGPYYPAWASYARHRDEARLAAEISRTYATSATYAARVVEVMRVPELRRAIDSARWQILQEEQH